MAYKNNIEQLTEGNDKFRQVLYTSKGLQLVVMALKPSEEIGEEIHEDNDQFFRFESGVGKAVVNGEEFELSDGDVIIIPMGAKHNIINTSSDEPLKLYTIYCPPHHKDKTIHMTKEEAMADDEHFDGQTTETAI